jgi:hypothetical protein
MLIYEQGNEQCVIVLDKSDKNRDVESESPLSFHSFRSKSFHDFQRANFVIFIDDDNRIILKDRGDGTDYETYVEALLTNEKRSKNLEIILG